MRIVTLLTIVCILVDPRHAQINNCGLDKFRCHNGECIQGELLCDGTAHCRDLSDETEEECKRSEILCPDYAFRCKYGACVNGDAVCNGIKDCIDNSDETLLRCANNPTKMPVTVRCNRNEFACDNGQCIDSIDVCDGTRNCADGSDEVFEKCGSITCNPTVFRCAYGACINGNLRCNGVADCADGSDEDPSICGATRWPSSNPTSPTPPSVTPLVTPSTPRSCKAPPQPPNGFWKLHRLQCDSGRECDVAEGVELQLGSHLIYSCNPGYKIRGTTDVICSLGGNWLNKPVCLEIRCQALSSVSTNADCKYNGNWVSCGSQVLPGTSAKLTCRNSYRPETNLFLRDNVRCDENGQWDPQPMRCIPGPLTINIYLNNTQLTLQTTLDRNNATLIEVLDDRVVIHTNAQNQNYPNIDVRIPEANNNLTTEKPWIWR